MSASRNTKTSLLWYRADLNAWERGSFASRRWKGKPSLQERAWSNDFVTNWQQDKNTKTHSFNEKEGVIAYFDQISTGSKSCQSATWDSVTGSTHPLTSLKTSRPIDKSRWRVARVCNMNSDHQWKGVPNFRWSSKILDWKSGFWGRKGWLPRNTCDFGRDWEGSEVQESKVIKSELRGPCGSNRWRHWYIQLSKRLCVSLDGCCYWYCIVVVKTMAIV